MQLHLQGLTNPLVMTPLPIGGESVLGYILRLTEQNGYQSPLKLLRYAGMDDNEARSVRPPLSKLASVLRAPQSELKAIGIDDAQDDYSGRQIHLQGHTVSSMHMACKRTGICLDCVKSHGYIHAFNEIKYAHVCPVHRKKMLFQCPACQKPLVWHRSGLTQCRCGVDFSYAEPECCENTTVIALMREIYLKLSVPNIDELHAAESGNVGFPTGAMRKLSLNTLLSVIHRFGLFNESSGDALQDEWKAIETAAEAFSNWPHQFHAYLHRVHAPKADKNAAGLRGQFRSFYESFFKNIEAQDEVKFMREAFLNFGQQWKKAHIHPKMRPEGMSNQTTDYVSNIVGIDAFAKIHKMHPATVRQYVAQGLIKTSHEVGANGRMLFDLTKQQQFEFAQGKSLSLGDASVILELPEAVLRCYRKLGLYQPRYFAVPPTLFHEKDVQALKDKLLTGTKHLKVYDLKHHLTMTQIMLKKLGPADVKAKFIDAVAKQEIRPIGFLRPSPSQLVFDKKAVKDWLNQIHTKLQGSHACQDVMDTAQLNPATLQALLKSTMIKGKVIDSEIRIDEASFEAFNASFIACQQVAMLKGISYQTVLQLCDALSIVRYRFLMSEQQYSKAFITRAELTLLGLGHCFVEMQAAA